MPKTGIVPDSLHSAAPILAQLVACGMMGRAEALAAFVTMALPARVSDCGRRARLSPQAPSVEIHRAEAARAARAVLRPLLAARVSPQVLRAAARAAAASALNRSEIDRIANDSIAHHLRMLRCNAAIGPITQHLVIKG